MPTKTNASDRLRRAPNGIDSAKPIAMRLTVEERAFAEKIAAEQVRTLAATCRLLWLRGVAEYNRDPGKLTDPVEIPGA